jgi:hypothetical protein
MKTDFYPSLEVKAFGERLMSAMFDASVRKSMAGLGGCLEYNLKDFDEDLGPHIQRYINNDCNVIVAVHEKKGCVEMRAFDNIEKAWAWKEEIAHENWDESDGPFDELAYWDYAWDEWFTCEEVEVE